MILKGEVSCAPCVGSREGISDTSGAGFILFDRSYELAACLDVYLTGFNNFLEDFGILFGKHLDTALMIKLMATLAQRMDNVIVVASDKFLDFSPRIGLFDLFKMLLMAGHVPQSLKFI